jgi:methyl-accepting chemotaxis protein
MEAIAAAVDRAQAVIEFAIDGTILTANQNFLGTMGYGLEEIQGRHHSMFVDPAERESADYRMFWERLRAGQFQQAEYKRLAKGGREVWIQATYNPLMDRKQRVYKVVKFAVDVTAAKNRAMEDAGQIKAIDRSQAVISFKLDGTILNANENFLATMGYRLEDIVGKHHSMFVGRQERESESYRTFWDRLARGEFFNGTFKRVKNGGAEVWIQGGYNPVMDANNRPVKVVKIATDITSTIKLAKDINEVVAAVSAAATEMRASSETMRANADQGRDKASMAAAASEQLSSAITEISQQVVRTQERATSALNETERAQEVVKSLEQASTTIGKVVEFINNIAEQTNLLALNATIEAARAGNAGRGFAVVASEVKALAKQTAQATGDILQQINDIQSATGSVVKANNAINATVAQINEFSSAVAAAVEEQSAATQSVASNIVEVSQVNAENERATTDMTGAAAELAQQAEHLRSQVDQYLRQLGVSN